MHDSGTPFRFDLTSLLDRARRLPVQLDGVSVNLPFITISVKPDDVERRVAREVVIRLAGRRVSTARECCDHCIDRAFESLQEIRSLLVDKEVELSDHADGPLYLVLDVMLQGVRQFFTFVETLDRQSYEGKRAYFAALEMLRGHLYASRAQVALMASMPVPMPAVEMRYDAVWQPDAYVRWQASGPDGGR